MPTSATSDAAIWDAAETMPRERAASLQLRRLRETVDRVLRAEPAGARRLADAGVAAADDIGSLADVAADAVHDQGRPARRSTRSGCSPSRASELVRIHASSGTHGKPTVVGYTRADLDDLDRADGALHDDGRRAARDAGPQRLRLRAVHRRARLSPGRRAARRDGRPGVRRLHRAPGAAAARPRRQVLCPRLPTRWSSPRRCAKRASTRASSRWSSGCSAPSRGREGMRERDRARARPEARSTSTACRRCAARAWPPSASTPAPGCTSRRTTSWSRSIDPDSGRAVPAGEEGELVFTTLTKEALPLIRYRTGDIGLADLDPCACGRTHARA